MRKSIIIFTTFLTFCLIISFIFFNGLDDRISFYFGGFLASSIISFVFYKIGLIPKLDDFNRRQANLFYFLSLNESFKDLKYHQVIVEDGKKGLFPVRIAKSEHDILYIIRLDLKTSNFFVKKLEDAINLNLTQESFSTCEELVKFLWYN